MQFFVFMPQADSLDSGGPYSPRMVLTIGVMSTVLGPV